MKKCKSFQSRRPFKQKIILVLFGIFLFFTLLEASLRLGGFILLSMQEHRNIQSIRQKGAYRILCLGESTSLGYPALLEEILNQRNVGIRFSVITKGQGGVTTSYILGRLDANLNNYHPDMVVTMMGINDAGEHVPYEVVTTSQIMPLFKSFRTYKLTRLLWLHILTKAKEVGFYKPNADKRHPKKVHAHLPIIGLKEAYAESVSEEDSLKQAIELNPKNDGLYFELGWFYRDRGKLSQAEDAFKKTVELNPENDPAYVELGLVYKEQGKFSQAEDTFKKNIEISPDSYETYICLGKLYWEQGKFPQVEDSFKKVIELEPKYSGAYFQLGLFYRDQGKFSQAEDSFKKVIELDPKDGRGYGAISILYKEMGKLELAEEYAKKTNTMRFEPCNPGTVRNYHKLKETLDKRGIRLVCVQYPMLSMGLLKRIFADDENGIIFVDNEKIFKDAVKKEGSRAYFTDLFAGEFGHCSKKGDRLLAENIANIILQEVFGK